MKSNDFHASIRKTTKVNVNEQVHNLPPDRGGFKEYNVADYDCPAEWSKDGVFIPVKEGDPMWFDFRDNDECAIIVTVQKVNPVTGERVELKLSKDPKQNYLKMPEQRWLDGYSNEGKVYQFVVTKSGLMSAVNEYVLPVHEQDSYAIGFAFFGLKNPKPKIVHEHYYDYPLDNHNLGCYPKPGSVSGSWWPTKGKTKGIMRSQGMVYGSHTSTDADDAIPCSCDSLNDASLDADYCCTDEPAMAGPVNYSVGAAAASASDIQDIQEQLAATANDPDLTIVTHHSVGNIDEMVTAEEQTRGELDHTDFEKASMGQGGRISQEIITDNNTVDYYVEQPSVVMNYYLCLPEQFEAIMKSGKKSDPNRKDKFVKSGQVGGVQIPLI